MGILKEFAVNAKTDGQAWNELEVRKHVCSIDNTHNFICFYDLSVGDNSPSDIGEEIILLQDDVNPNAKIYTTKD